MVDHIPLSEIAHLTDRQIVEIYGHARDKEGRLETVGGRVDVAMTPEQEDRMMEQFARSAGVSESEIADLKRRAAEKRAASGDVANHDATATDV